MRRSPTTQFSGDRTDRSIRTSALNPLPVKETNWIPTAPGRDWFPYFRLYGPEASFFTERQNWELPAIERLDR